MRDWGLILAGGGGKGAYQIGVWRAMRRLGLDKRIAVVSGTSVGAINAALFAQGDLKKAKSIWTSLEPGQILSPEKEDKGSDPSESVPKETEKKLLRFLGVTTTAAFAPLGLGILSLTRYIQEMLEKGIVPNRGLYKLLQTCLDPQKVIESPVKCYATCMPVKEQGQEQEAAKRYLLDRCPPEQIPSIILASAAIPYVFPQVEIEGERYHDGGVPWEKRVGSDNIPVSPAYAEGCRTLIVVHMGKRGTCEEMRDSFPGARLIEVCPDKPMPGTDVLNFTHDFVMESMEKGYYDGDFILEDYVEEDD